jgi:hypothetical protein
LNEVVKERLGSRIALGAPGNVHLAEQHHPLAFALFQ